MSSRGSGWFDWLRVYGPRIQRRAGSGKPLFSVAAEQCNRRNGGLNGSKASNTLLSADKNSGSIPLKYATCFLGANTLQTVCVCVCQNFSQPTFLQFYFHFLLKFSARLPFSLPLLIVHDLFTPFFFFLVHFFIRSLLKY